MSSNRQDPFVQRRERFRQYETPEAIIAYLQRLEDGWPARAAIARHIAHSITRLEEDIPRVLELCCGPGWLAERLLTTLPTIEYTGVDLSPPFLAFAQDRLEAHQNRTRFCELDLSTEDWPATLQQQCIDRQFHTVVSLQSLHDVGDEQAIHQVYRQVRELLLPNGFFLNADLIVAEDEKLPNNPGRLSIARHLALLQEVGYTHMRCSLVTEGFGCVEGIHMEGDTNDNG